MGIFNEKLLDFRILVRRKNDGIAVFSIASGASGLLIIPLDASGKVVVDNEPDVFFIDSHSKRVSRHDGLVTVVHKGVLNVFPVLVRYAAGVFRYGNSFFHEIIVRFANVFDGRTVDDSDAGGFFDDFLHFRKFRLLLRNFANDDRHVRTIEPLDERFEFLQSQPLYDIGADFSRSGCRKRHDGHSPFVQPERLYEIANLQVTRSEIVSPLADTVGLVDGEKAHVHPREGFHEETAPQPFRSDVEEFYGVFGIVVPLQFL